MRQAALSVRFRTSVFVSGIVTSAAACVAMAMMISEDSTSPRLLARVAGLVYLLLIVSGGVGYYSSAALVVDGDTAATARSILDAESLWRAGLAALLVMLVCDVVVAVLFYVLFEPVNRTASLLAMAFRLVMTAVLAVNLFTRSGTPLLLRDATLDADQRQALALVALAHFDRGFNIALVFFGGCCLAIGWLISRATFMPWRAGLVLVARHDGRERRAVAQRAAGTGCSGSTLKMSLRPRAERLLNPQIDSRCRPSYTCPCT
jgi:hypothetical protein